MDQWPMMTMGACDIDIDNDLSNDVQFIHQVYSSPGFTRIYLGVTSISNIEFAVSTPSVGDTLPKNSVVDNSLLWQNPSPNHCLLRLIYYSSSSNYTGGLFFGSQNLYLGFRKRAVNDTLYGWFLLDMVSGPYVIKSYAYEKTTVDIKEKALIENSVLIFPSPTAEKLSIKNQSNQRIEQTKLYSTDGREIDLMKLEENVYDMSSLPEGIYILHLKLENAVLNKKIVIQR